MKALNRILLIVFIISSIIRGQTKRIYSEAPVMIENGVIKSTQLNIKFKHKVFNFSKEKPEGDLTKIIDGQNNLRQFLSVLEKKFLKRFGATLFIMTNKAK